MLVLLNRQLIAAPLTADQARAIMKEAYIYSFPLVITTASNIPTSSITTARSLRRLGTKFITNARKPREEVK
jgi:hypothetical protein